MVRNFTSTRVNTLRDYSIQKYIEKVYNIYFLLIHKHYIYCLYNEF
jgi:hypothetical protein